jgi:hypothetical protein
MSPRALVIWCSVWATAFGVVEAAVVVYLRALYYPEGFRFPLKAFDPGLLGTEVVREAATLVMLLGVAMVAVRGGLRRFAVFSLCFGVWDLVYYLGLSAFVGWPATLLDWDVLFLIPLPWIAPVLAPVLVSLALIGCALAMLRAPCGPDGSLAVAGVLRPVDWLVEVVAGLVIIGSFLWNASAIAGGGVPTRYPWWLFLIGLFGGVGWFAVRWRGAFPRPGTPPR